MYESMLEIFVKLLESLNVCVKCSIYIFPERILKNSMSNYVYITFAASRRATAGSWYMYACICTLKGTSYWLCSLLFYTNYPQLIKSSSSNLVMEVVCLHVGNFETMKTSFNELLLKLFTYMSTLQSGRSPSPVDANHPDLGFPYFHSIIEDMVGWYF